MQPLGLVCVIPWLGVPTGDATVKKRFVLYGTLVGIIPFYRVLFSTPLKNEA